MLTERLVEFAFAFKHLSRVYPKSVMDVGSGLSAFPALVQEGGTIEVVAIDNWKDYWIAPFVNSHFSVVSDDITEEKARGPFEAITCISTLEHIRSFYPAVKNMVAALAPSGVLIMTFPFCEAVYHHNIYEHPEAGYGQKASFICQVFSRMEVDRWCQDLELVVKDQEFWKVFTGRMWTFGERLKLPLPSLSSLPHELLCIALERQK